MSCNRCTCMSFFKVNHFKLFIAESYGDEVCGITKGKGALCGDRETGFIFRHLEGVDKGHLGTKSHRRLPNTLCWNSHPTSSALRAQGSTTGGDSGPSPQRSSYPTIRRRNQIHLHLFLVPKRNGQIRPFVIAEAV